MNMLPLELENIIINYKEDLENFLNELPILLSIGCQCECYRKICRKCFTFDLLSLKYQKIKINCIRQDNNKCINVLLEGNDKDRLFFIEEMIEIYGGKLEMNFSKRYIEDKLQKVREWSLYLKIF